MRIESLTFFRFLAAFVVVMFHFGYETSLAKSAPSFFNSGPEFVTFFFVLSGFVLSITYINNKNINIKSYYIKRLARIFPLFLFVLLFYVSMMTYWKGFPDIKTFLLNLTMLHAWFPSKALSLNYADWSISVEIFFYITFPFTIVFLKNKNFTAKTIIALSAILWLLTQLILIYLYNSNFYLSDKKSIDSIILYFPLSHYCSFFMGISCGYIFTTYKEKISIKKNTSYIVYPLIILFTFLIINNKLFFQKITDLNIPLGSSFFAPLFVFLIIATALTDNQITKTLSHKIFKTLGEASYAMYLLHVPIRIYYEIIIVPMIGSTTQNGKFIFYFAILLTVSLIIHFLIEKPANRFIRKKFAKTN